MLRAMALAVMLFSVASVDAATKVQIAQGEQVVTLRVDGELIINPEGGVKDYRISTKIDPQVEKLVSKAVRTWRFRPILKGGLPVIAKTPMRITLAAVEVANGYEVRVDNVMFHANTKNESEDARAAQRAAWEQHRPIAVMSDDGDVEEQNALVEAIKMTPPGYPKGMLMAGVEGRVLLNLLLDPSGKVAEVFAAQSSLLNVKGKPEMLDRVRAMLEKNAVVAAKKWTFTVKTRPGATLKPDDLTLRVPVDYVLASPGSEGPSLAGGKWRHEYRGPGYPVPWLIGEDAEQFVGVSDVDDGEFVAGKSPFKLQDRAVIGKTL